MTWIGIKHSIIAGMVFIYGMYFSHCDGSLYPVSKKEPFKENLEHVTDDTETETIDSGVNQKKTCINLDLVEELGGDSVEVSFIGICMDDVTECTSGYVHNDRCEVGHECEDYQICCILSDQCTNLVEQDSSLNSWCIHSENVCTDNTTFFQYGCVDNGVCCVKLESNDGTM